MTDLTTAKTILQQLGGNKFIACTGCKNFVADNYKLNMRLTRNKVNAQYLTIYLNVMDLYDLVFTSVNKDLDIIVKAERKNVYFDDLQNVFTEVTGLITQL